MVQGSGFRIQGLGFRVEEFAQGSGFKGASFRGWGIVFRV
jgi:hypothetical protein